MEKLAKLYGIAGTIAYYTQWSNDTEEQVEVIILISYGCTTLRITEFPVR